MALVKNGFIKFEYEILNAKTGRFILYIDGHESRVYTEKGRHDSLINLSKGEHVARWIYKSGGLDFEEVRIHYLIIEGSLEGGAGKCVKCDLDQVSDVRSVVCYRCQPGYAPNENNQKCEKCKGNYYSYDGKICKQCHKNTRSNEERTACVGLGYLDFPNSYYTELLVDNSGEHELAIYSHQSFYGPILVPSSNQMFYISVLNASEFSYPGYDYYKNKSLGYAFSLIDNRNPNKFCSEQVILNIGSQIDTLEDHKNGFLIRYSAGDECEDRNFTTEINFLCNKRVNRGWPQLKEIVDCGYKFE